MGDRARGGERRFTGSRWLPSGGIPPPTTFYGEGTPTVDIGTWRLEVVTPATVEPTPWSLPDIHALGEDDLSAVLDCTSGWAIETAWRGVPLARLLGRAAETERGSVRVTSITGWATILTMAEAREGFLATGVAGGELPVANGAPCRLVIPRRRGLDWVKWVAEIRVS